jgi:hypothetical protein
MPTVVGIHKQYFLTHFKTCETYLVKMGYVVLYVADPIASLNFWLQKIGMIEKGKKQIASFSIVRLGFAEQDFSLELVPLELMKDNPNKLDLATPSLAFYDSNLVEIRESLISRDVRVTDISEFSGVTSFAFMDNENRAFAVIQK